MKLSRFIEKNPLEVLLAVILIIFILSPIQPPASIANAIDSTLGIVITSILIVYLFVYSHTLLAVLFVIAIFELVRRSSTRNAHKPSVVTYTALQPPREEEPTVEYAPAQDSTSVPTSGKNMMQPEREQERRDLDGNMLRYGGPGMIGMGGPMPRERLSSNMQSQFGNEFVDFETNQAQRDREMMQMNTKLMEISLEEQLVHNMPTPSVQQDYLDTSYKPVYNNIHQASPF